MLKIAFYYNHYNTLGHSTRVFSLIKAFKERHGKHTEVLVLRGGVAQDFFPFERYARVVSLPFSFDKRGLAVESNRRLYHELTQGGRLNNMLKKRLKICTDSLEAFSPDIFITEYYPFGQEFWTFEVPHILKFLKTKLSCRIVSSAGYLSWTPGMQDMIKTYYDLLLIHSPGSFARDYEKYLPEEGSRVLKAVFAHCGPKIHFTGFVKEAFEASRVRKDISGIPAGWRGKKLILVSRGGGIVNQKIIAASLLTAKRNKNMVFAIICGPSTPQKEWRAWQKLAKGSANVRLFKSLPPADFIRLMKKADLCVNMAGYNTSVKLLDFHKPAVLVPYKTTEQLWRARHLKTLLPVKIIMEQALNCETLEKNIHALLKIVPETGPCRRSWFNGARESIKILEDHLYG